MPNYNHPDNERKAGSHFPEWMGDIPLSGMSWLRSLDEELSRNIRAGMPICLIAIHHGRSCGAIVGRLKEKEPRFKDYWDSRYSHHRNKYGEAYRKDLSYLFITDVCCAQQRQYEDLEEWQARQYREAAERREYLADDTVEIKIEGEGILEVLGKERAARIEERVQQQEWVATRLEVYFKQTKKSVLFILGVSVALNALLAAVIATSL